LGEGGIIEHEICALILSTTFVILTRIQRDII
jgi:hypothetical protein